MVCSGCYMTVTDVNRRSIGRRELVNKMQCGARLE